MDGASSPRTEMLYRKQIFQIGFQFFSFWQTLIWAEHLTGFNILVAASSALTCGGNSEGIINVMSQKLKEAKAEQILSQLTDHPYPSVHAVCNFVYHCAISPLPNVAFSTSRISFWAGCTSCVHHSNYTVPIFLSEWERKEDETWTPYELSVNLRFIWWCNDALCFIVFSFSNNF